MQQPVEEFVKKTAVERFYALANTWILIVLAVTVAVIPVTFLGFGQRKGASRRILAKFCGDAGRSPRRPSESTLLASLSNGSGKDD
jgi:hypothetical protein